MEIILRSIPHGVYVSENTDAISCTLNIDGFTPMKSVLIAHGLDQYHFNKKSLEQYHKNRGFRVVVHGDQRPTVITSSKTENWESISDAAFLILQAAAHENRKSLCFTQFAFILGAFPELGFKQCMRAIHVADQYTDLEKIIVDIDESFIDQANSISMGVKAEIDAQTPEIKTIFPEVDAMVAWLDKQEAKEKNIRIEPVTNTANLIEQAESGDVGAMTKLGQYYRSQFPFLALKWLLIAASHGSRLAFLLLENEESKVSDRVKEAAYKMSIYWFEDLLRMKKGGLDQTRLSKVLATSSSWH